jgi:hypothetical protein
MSQCQGIINKDWARPARFQICYLCCFFVIRVVLFLIVLFYVLRVNVYCHRVSTQLQLTNISISISYHISYHIIPYQYHISYHISIYHISIYHIILYHINIISYQYHIIYQYHIVSISYINIISYQYLIISYLKASCFNTATFEVPIANHSSKELLQVARVRSKFNEVICNTLHSRPLSH